MRVGVVKNVPNHLVRLNEKKNITRYLLVTGK